MISKNTIDNFLENKKMAMAGVSRNKKKFSRVIFKELRDKGFEIIPINPNASEIEGVTCYSDVNSIPGEIENLFVVTPKSQTEEIVKQAKEKNIKRIWIQQMSETFESLKIAKEANMELIYKKCIFMYAEPVKGIHKFHRAIKKFFGKLYN